MGGDLVEQAGMARSPPCAATSRAWARISPTSSAFCSPVEPSAAGMSFWAWRTSKSTRCGPVSVRPAARSKAARARPSARSSRSSSAEDSGACRSSNSGVSARRAAGKFWSSRLSSDQRLQVGEASTRAKCIAAAQLGHLRLDRLEPERIGILLEQPVALAHGLFVVATPWPNGRGSASSPAGRESAAGRSRGR